MRFRLARDDEAKGSYTYPNTSEDEDYKDVLKNKLNIRSYSELREAEYAITDSRITELAEGKGPTGNHDAAHLKALHGYIFQDIYEWAGHTRNESPVVDGHRVEPVGGLSKGDTTFLPGSRIEMGLNEALRPARDVQGLRAATPEQFAEKAAHVLSELNYVHAFREGNGRANEALVVSLGRTYGHDIDLTVITKPRMIEASIETTNDPSSPAMKHLIQDAMDPNRREAIRSAMSDLEQAGEKPFEHNIRTARQGEVIEGQVLGHDNRVASLVTEKGIVAVDRADLPEQIPADNEEVKFTARSDFKTLGRPEQVQDAHSQPGQQKAQEPQSQHINAELKAIEAQQLADRQRNRDQDDRER